METIKIQDLVERDDIIIQVTSKDLREFAKMVYQMELSKSKYMTLADVADILGKTQQTIRNYIKTGVLTPSKKIGKNYLFDLEHINNFKSHYGTRNYRMALSEIREDNGI